MPCRENTATDKNDRPLEDVRILKATVVGEQTYGKGIGQTTRQLSDGSYIKFTTFRYFTANHVDFNGVGLTPDIEVELSSEKRAKLYELSLEEDDQLYAAWKAVGQ